eukprot:CAMPEP_0118654184 /NCGR_PEP_ID=MMETSP0785-20121206/12250_1 /TAXON_ID=91992 /ORGANISM="Bolidomonas pacifica, Strain CCMP 1866" /LENGTH=246 /DNA_ID=CAMNT_0006546819 /DNA_START=18 /DNA_END=758 /DNA_ORIENTATION=+
MKFSLILLTLLGTASAFSPLMATRAIGKPSATKVVAKKSATKAVKKSAPALPTFNFKAPSLPAKKAAPAKKAVVAKKAAPKKSFSAPKLSTMKKTTRGPPPASKGYPSFSDKAGSIKFKGISGSGLFPAANGGFPVPDLSDPKLQKTRDPAFYAAAAAQRAAKLNTPGDFVYEDGLSALEKRQKNGALGDFLTGSAKSQIDQTAIVGEIEAPAFGGLSADRFQLLFISVFGLFTLVGSLANAKPYV